jgi:hypothetical protein
VLALAALGRAVLALGALEVVSYRVLFSLKNHLCSENLETPSSLSIQPLSATVLQRCP